MTDQLAKQYNDTQLQLVKDSIDLNYKLLVEDPAKELNQLPENIFVNYFLPFFCGERSFNDNPELLATWIGIAGNPTKEVQIIDQSGKTLFNVPSVVDTSFIDVNNERRGQPFFSIIANYELHKNQLPVVGENYLKNTMEQRYDTLTKDSSTHAVNEKRWTDIFVRYDKVKAKVTTEQVRSDKLSDDEISYD